MSNASGVRRIEIVMRMLNNMVSNPSHVDAMRYAVAFRESYDQSQNIADLNVAIFAARRGIFLAPDIDELLPICRSLLGLMMHTRYMRTRELSDITEAIELLREEANLTPKGNESHPEAIFHLTSALRDRFNHTHALNDVDEAVNILQDLVDNMNPDHIQYSLSLYRLSYALKKRYEYSGDLDDVTRAINAQEMGNASVTDKHSDLPLWLDHLGWAYIEYFRRTGETQHIEMAIDAQKKAISLNSHMPGFHQNFAVSHIHRFKAKGDRNDLEKAMSLLQRSILLCGDGHPSMQKSLTNLGDLFQTRFSLTRDVNDLHEAVRACKEAVLRTGNEHRDLPTFLNNFGNATLTLFEVTHNISELSEAILSYEKASKLALNTHEESLTILCKLGGALSARFRITGCKSDITNSISALRTCVALCPSKHSKLPEYLSQLTIGLIALFEDQHQLGILDEAISVMKRSISITSESNIELTLLYTKLGGLYYTRFKATGKNDDIDNAIKQFGIATQTHIVVPTNQLLSGRLWGLLSYGSHPEQALLCYKKLFTDIVPQLAWIGRTMSQRYYLLETLADTVGEAAAAAVNFGLLTKAVEWMEQGRSMVWNQLHTLRTPFEDLRKVDPVLCDELEKVGTALQEASMRMNPQTPELADANINHMISVQDDVRKHQALANQWNSLLSKARSISGFNNLLRPMSYSSFSDLVPVLPSRSWIVIVNVSRLSSDALLLSRNKSTDETVIKMLNLDDFYARAVFYRRKLHELLSHPASRTRSMRAGRIFVRKEKIFSLKNLLRDLWIQIVKPILDAINLRPTSNNLARIWWCPIGPLAFLPLHAAGDYYHYEGNTPNPASDVMEFAISSYTPTISALKQSMSKHNQQIAHEFKGVMTISEPQAPGLSPIYNTSLELNNIKQIFNQLPLNFHCLEGVDATVENVSKSMPHYSWIHISCHALQNESPLESAFYLRDGKLSIGDIIKHPLPYAQFSFLSACETGMGDKKISEEAVHLAGGMLAAGYTSVVATMWSISDEYAPNVAKDFYSHILQRNDNESMNTLDCTRAAAALHFAVTKFRKATGDDDDGLLLWVPYIHVGI